MSSTSTRRKRRKVAQDVRAAYLEAAGQAYSTGGDQDDVATAAVLAALRKLAPHVCEQFPAQDDENDPCPGCHLSKVATDLAKMKDTPPAPAEDHRWTLVEAYGAWCAATPKADPTAKHPGPISWVPMEDDPRRAYPFGKAKDQAEWAVEQANAHRQNTEA